MRRGRHRVAIVIAVAAMLGVVPGALAGGKPRDARIAGRVIECNTPDTCVQNGRFHVSAINSSGQTVARTTTTGAKNHFALQVVPGPYQLVAKGPMCKAQATAHAHKTTHQNITCLVP